MFRFFIKNGLAQLDELYFPNEEIDWKQPWWCLDECLEVRTGIQRELNSEISRRHPLWGLKPVVIGKTDVNDDVIVSLKDGRYACVHLVWHGKIDRYPNQFPSTLIFENVEKLQLFLNEESIEYI